MNVSDPLFPSAHKALRGKSATSGVEDLVTTGLGKFVTALVATPTTSAHTTTVTVSNNSVSSNQHFWDVSLYLEIAIPLAATTVVLPLIIGSVVRLWVRTAYEYRLYWRVLCAVGALAYLGLVYGFLFWFSDDPCTNGDFDCPSYWYYAHSYAAFVCYVVLVPSVLGCIAVWAIYRAIRLRRRRKLWTLFAILVIGSALVELFVDYPALTSWGLNTDDNDVDGWAAFRPIPLTWIPWVFLIVHWLSTKERDRPNPFPTGILKNPRTLSLVTHWRHEK